MKRLAEIIGAKAYALDKAEETNFYKSEEEAISEAIEAFKEGHGNILLEAISEYIFEETNFNIDPTL